MQTTVKTTLAKFAGTCKGCGKPIALGTPLLPSIIHRGAKGKAAFIHVECSRIENENNGRGVQQPEPVVAKQLPEPTMQAKPVEPSPVLSAVSISRKQFIQLLDEVMPTYDWDVDVSGDINPIKEKMETLERNVESALARIGAQRGNGGSFELKIQVADMPMVTMKEVPNKAFDDVLLLAANRMNVMMVGPTGSGKTYLAKQVAKALKMDFGHVSCSRGMSEWHITGRNMNTGKNGSMEYTQSEFIRLYENGGLFLFDEVDAADDNVMMCIQSAISNGFMSLPQRSKKPTAKRHKDFICMAAANTFGRGPNRMYCGRNQLDAATLDRFLIGQVEVDYDENVEARLCPDATLRGKLTAIREKIMQHSLRRAVSTRFMQDAYVMSKAGWGWDKIFGALTRGYTADELAKINY